MIPLVIASGRKTSRTTRLLERCQELNSQGELTYLVCMTREEVQRVSQKATEMGYNIPFPITFGEFLGYNYSSRNIKHFLIDNADYLLQMLTAVPIEGITLHKEPDAA